MSNYEKLVYGFLTGSGLKLMDDIFDIYKKESVNEYFLEMLKIILVIIFVLSGLYPNYFNYFLIFGQWWPAVVLPDAYTTEPYWASFTLIILTFTVFNIIYQFNSKPIKLIILYNVLFYVQWFSGFSTEVGEWVPYIKPLKKYFPSLYPYFFLENDVEISSKKMYFRFLNVLLCVYMLLFGNAQLLHYFNIEDIDFINILPITSWCILGYNLVSVINQANMLYFINYKEQKIHKQVNGFFGIDINDKAAAAADDDESDTNKDEKPNKYK
jgi:hypothetical protein